MSPKRVFTTSDRKEPEEQSGATRQGRKVLGQPPRAKTSSRAKTRKPLPPEKHDGDSPLVNEDIQPRIAERAYELYQRRGGHHGQDLDDYFRAEQEVMAEESSENLQP